MLDIERLQKLIIKISDILVGESLSRIEDTPAIIKEYSSVIRPDYPYLTFDINDLGADTEIRHTEDYFEGGYLIQYSNHEAVLRLTCYGQNAKQIISKLYSGFNRKSTLRIIEEDYPDIKIKQYRGIRSASVATETEYLHNSTFSIIFKYINIEKDYLSPEIIPEDIRIKVYADAQQPKYDSTIDITNKTITSNITGNP